MTPADQLPIEDPEAVMVPPPDDVRTFIYWASTDGEELVGHLQAKEKAWFDSLERRGIVENWRIEHAQHFGLDPTGSGRNETQTIGFDGERGEQLVFRINEARSFARQIVGMTTSQRPAFKCMALNSDFSSVTKIQSSDTVITYFYKQSFGEAREREAVEADYLFGAAYGWARWDVDGGEDVEVKRTVTTTKPLPDGTTTTVPEEIAEQVRSGTVVCQQLFPWEVCQQPSKVTNHLWRIVRERVSKAELIARYPEFEQELVGVSTAIDEYCAEALFGYDLADADEDDVIVKHFYHARSEAIPDGRYVGVCGTTILWDRPNPVSRTVGTPIVELCTSRFTSTSIGYGDGWDLCAINQAIDQVNSDVLTTISTYGRPTMVVDENTDYDADALANGNRVLTKQRDAEMPKWVEPPTIQSFVQWYLEYKHARMGTISGINNTARGIADTNVTSGEHAALYHNIAIEFQSPRIAALDAFREGMANLILDIVRMNAQAPFLIEVAGVDQRPYLEQFDTSSISGVRRVVVETANPMMRSQAGRLEIFKSVWPLKPEERAGAMQLITTGSSAQITHPDESCNNRIKWENEQLAQGIPVQVGALDDPFKHIPKHWAEVEAMSAQWDKEPEKLQTFLDHIMGHLPAWFALDPSLAAMQKIPPPPPPPGPPGAPQAGPPGAPGPRPPGPGGGPPANDNGKPPDVQPPRAKDPTGGTPIPKPAGPPPEAKVGS